MRKVPWWPCGLLGGAVLSLVTLVRFIGAAAFLWLTGTAIPGGWREAAGLIALMFAMGFVCGVVAWAGQGLSRRLGLAGDALIGVAVMVVFFLGCMVVFDPEMLGPRFATGGIPMFGLAVVAGLILGAWIGHDLRKEIAAGGAEDDPPAS